MKFRILPSLAMLTTFLGSFSMVHAIDGQALASQRMPLSFMENKGQIVDQFGRQRSDIDFRISTPGVQVFIGDGALHYQWSQGKGVKKSPVPVGLRGKVLLPDSVQTYRMDVTLLGANRNVRAITESKTDYYEQYYLPQTGAAGVLTESYRKITYPGVYPNIDWVIYINKDKVEYDFIVHPGGKVADIKMKYGGAASLNINEDGSFTAKTIMGSLTEKAPYSYQENGQKVGSRFVVNDDGVLGFVTDSYKGKLIIDPSLAWSTYYGGDALFLDAAYSVVTDREHNVYMSGSTISTTNIATTGAHQMTVAGEADVYVAKFNGAGKRLWGTYYGGSSYDGAGAGSWYTAVACDTLGNVYVAAATSSDDGIATANAHQTTNKGGGGASTDLFLAKLNGEGKRLWGTFYGGPESESMLQTGLASDGSNVYLAGFTGSFSSIATPGSYQDFYGGGTYDAFLVKFNTEGVRQWATYYGGAEWELAEPGITCDRLGNIYLTATTSSTFDIATPTSFQPAFAGATTWGDAFLVKFNPAGQRLWATYYGGPGDDWGYAVSCDDSLNVYLLGKTSSLSGIATPGAHQTVLAGDLDAFLVKFNGKGERQWGSYYGGASTDWPYSISATKDAIYISGDTDSDTGIATPGSPQEIYGGSWFSYYGGDAFVAAFSPSGQRQWGTYFGGFGPNLAFGMAYDPNGYLYICGRTSDDPAIPTPGSYQDTFPGGMLQSFLTKFCLDIKPVISGVDSQCASSTEVYTISPVADATAYLWELPSGWSGSSNTESIVVTAGANSGTIKVKVVRCNDTSEAASIDVRVLEAYPVDITVNGFVLGTVLEYYTYQWYLNGKLIPGAVERNYTVKENGEYTVITAEKNGCSHTSDGYVVNNVSVSEVERLREQIRMYPNPVGENLLSLQSPVPVRINISSIEGKQVLLQAETKSVDISALPAGMYLVHIYDKSGHLLKTEKLVRLKP